MSDFADIERFVRAHAACGGITPNATTPRGGGYLLTLTCACGVSMERWITAEEAKQPLPLARSAPASAPARAPAPPAPAAPRAPSPDLEEVMRLALEAEDAAAKAPAPPPVRPAAPRVSLDEALRLAVDADVAATPPPPPPAPPPPVAARGRSALPRLAADDAVKAAMKETQTLAAAVPAAASGSRFWFGVVIVVLLLGGAGIWLGLQKLTEEAELESTAGVPAVALPPLSAAERAALGEVLRPLRDLQANSSQTVAYPVYSSHVDAAKADVDRYLGTTAPPELKAGVRDALELHLLAAAAWRARTLDGKELWEAVGEDPAVDLCPPAKSARDAQPPGTGSPAQARGVGIASAIPLLWECAAARLADLDRAAGN